MLNRLPKCYIFLMVTLVVRLFIFLYLSFKEKLNLERLFGAIITEVKIASNEAESLISDVLSIASSACEYLRIYSDVGDTKHSTNILFL